MRNDLFVDIKLTKKTIDIYLARKYSYEAIVKSKEQFKGKLLDVGCGQMPYKNFLLKNSNIKSYTGLDIETSLNYNDIKPDFTWNGTKMPFDDEAFDTIIATSVLEHCYDYNQVLNECIRILKPEGIFFFYIPFIWPFHEVPHDHFRYTPFSLQKIFREVGFKDVTTNPVDGWDGSLANFIGLWINRRPGTQKWKKDLFQFFGKIIIKALIKRDRAIKNFNESSITSGLYGTAIK